jgi:hypothetical protein
MRSLPEKSQPGKSKFFLVDAALVHPLYSLRYGIDKYIPNFSGSYWYKTSELQNITSFSVFCLCALAYGGIHASAWSEYFPTTLERTIWRASSIYSAVLGITIMTMGYIGLAMDPDENPVETWLSPLDDLDKSLGDREILNMSALVFIYTLVMVYVCSRSFLVVEAFISLRKLPIAAYNAPSWTQYLAHL